jgi:Winged helix DNA-binding domain
LRAIAGAQSQEPRAGRLQVRARARGMTADRIEHARLEERSILRHWVMRMTVHLIPADDYGWMAPLFSERILRWSRRRLGALGVSDSERDRVLAAAERALGSGPVRRSEVMEIAARHGVEPNVQRRTHLAVLLVVGGAACIGPDAGRESTFVATGDWIGEPRKMDRERALAELARRYFRAFAPAGERDFASWSGLPLGECRSGIDAIAAELTELTAAGETLLAPKGWTARTPRSPIVRLLPAFDTYLMGYASRAHAVDDAGARRILPGGGILRPTICVDGRFVGLWSSKRGGNRLAVALEPFEELDEALSDAIAAEVADIGRFEGTPANLA